jgi:nucleobase:cation symporter-1, NCS1 family
MFERLGRFWTTLIISVLGIILSAMPDVASGYTTYVGILGNVFSPIAGVLIADYLCVKRMRIDLVALFEPNGAYWYWKRFNIIAIVWTALGFLAYMVIIPAEWIRVMITLLATGAGDWAMIQLLAPYFEELSRASKILERSGRPSRSSIGIWPCAEGPPLAQADCRKSAALFQCRDRLPAGGR